MQHPVIFISSFLLYVKRYSILTVINKFVNLYENARVQSVRNTIHSRINDVLSKKVYCSEHEPVTTREKYSMRNQKYGMKHLKSTFVSTFTMMKINNIEYFIMKKHFFLLPVFMFFPFNNRVGCAHNQIIAIAVWSLAWRRKWSF